MTRLALVPRGTASRQSFEELVRPHYETLFRIAVRLTGSRHDAEDLVQETCVRAYRHIERAATLDNPRTWLICILRRLFIDLTRSHDRKRRDAFADPFLTDVPSPDRGPAESTDALLISRRVVHALAKLDNEQRALLILHDVEGYSLAELETIMEIKLGTLKSKLHRARIKLGRLLQASGLGNADVTSRSFPQ
jgi:RNA polymerase sigma-70 factor (ECF subfamily)